MDIPAQYQNIFSCDHAQLPKESLIYNSDYSKKIEKNQEFFTKDKIFDPQINNLIEEAINNNSSVPNKILISSTSQNDIKNYSKNLDLLSAPREFDLYERPLSRRGSRDSVQKVGIEEGEDNRTETPKPIDEFEIILKSKDDLKTNSSKQVWYSESEDESEEIEIYHPLESDDEQKTSLKNYTNNKLTNNKESSNKIFPIFKSCDTSDTEEDDHEVDANSEMFDSHNYRRLQESPFNIQQY